MKPVFLTSTSENMHDYVSKHRQAEMMKSTNAKQATLYKIIVKLQVDVRVQAIFSTYNDELSVMNIINNYFHVNENCRPSIFFYHNN